MVTYLLFLTSLELGGAERQALNFARYLMENGRRVIVVGIGQSGKVCEICKEENIVCVPLFVENTYGYKFFRVINFFISLMLKREFWDEGIALSYKIAKFIKSEKVDISISYCSPANTILGYAKKFYRKSKYVWYQRDAGLCYEPWQYRDKALRMNDYVLANAKGGQDWLKKHHNIDSMVIYNGVVMMPPEKNAEQWRKELNVDVSHHICTMIANLSSAKNHLILLKAWKYMYDRNIGKEMILVFAGRFDEQYENLLSYVKENKISEKVRFLGQVDDISGLLAVTTIGVFGAISEGSPNGVIEPALWSLPIVATDLQEIREVVAKENYEFLFEAEDVESLVNNILCLAFDEELRCFVGKKNREKALKMFSAEENFKKIVDIIEANDASKS